MEKITLEVEGMSCGHCEKAIVNSLIDLGATSANANHVEGTVIVEFNPEKISRKAIEDEIIDIGYVVKGAK